MTTDKDFKKIVRARMARTGESYAAARSVLMAGGERRCRECGAHYSADEWVDSIYWDPPHDYRRGYLERCLACWLGVGPERPTGHPRRA